MIASVTGFNFFFILARIKGEKKGASCGSDLTHSSSAARR